MSETNKLNPVGLAVTEGIRNWTPTAELGALEGLKFSQHASPWGSMEYGISNKSKSRRVWINDYTDQLFIEVRFNLQEPSQQHTQRFHFMISDERRITEEVARFLLLGTLPEYNPAKKQYVAYLATPAAAVRKESIRLAREEKEAKAAEKEAQEKELASRPPVKEKKAPPVFSSPAPVEVVPAWKKRLTQLADLGNTLREKVTQ